VSSRSSERSRATDQSSAPAGGRRESAEVDRYVEAAPAAAQPLLREMRRLILDAAPEAVEKLSYGMPFYEYRGRRLAYFAANKDNVAVYALAHVDGDVPEELAPHLDHRSTLRLPLDRPLPAAALRRALQRKMSA
jgi:uncharacterized protein YdhG (YjbR/CyaY superfamily)